MMGTVGVPVTTVEARLESVPEMGYDALSEIPRGEICLRGTTLFSGYHRRPDLTDAVLEDGWFHTGERRALESTAPPRPPSCLQALARASSGGFLQGTSENGSRMVR